METGDFNAGGVVRSIIEMNRKISVKDICSLGFKEEEWYFLKEKDFNLRQGYFKLYRNIPIGFENEPIIFTLERISSINDEGNFLIFRECRIETLDELKKIFWHFSI